MNHHVSAAGYLERAVDNGRLARCLAARFDRALRRAGISSIRAAKWLGVSEYDVQYWRHGITVPPLNVCTRIAAILNLDVHWLCTGQAQAD